MNACTIFNVIVLFLAVAHLTYANRACSECDHVIEPASNPSATYVITDNDVLNLPKGSVICFSGAKTYASGFFIDNFVGSASQPYVLTNCDGVADISAVNGDMKVSHGVITRDTSYLKIIGDGDDKEKYGIKIHDCSKGLGIERGSSDVEVSRVEIFDNHGHAAVTCKTDPSDTNTEYWRRNFVLKNAIFHDMYIHDIATEGFYVGYFNYEFVTSTGGKPHDITGLRIYNNTVINTGWDAIQVGCAIEDAQVYDNIVENYGTDDELYQNSGIFINPGFKGSIFNNFVKEGTGAGLIYHGQGDTNVYNNVFVNTGGRGITMSIDTARTSPGTWVKINHNTIVSSRGDRGISVHNPDNGESPLYTFEAFNNIVIYTQYTSTVQWACVSLPGGRRTDAGNICSSSVESDYGFTNVAKDDFSLKSTSSFIDAGDARAGVDKDKRNYKRPEGAGPDIGAYEYHEFTPTSSPSGDTPTEAGTPVDTTNAPNDAGTPVDTTNTPNDAGSPVTQEPSMGTDLTGSSSLLYVNFVASMLVCIALLL